MCSNLKIALPLFALSVLVAVAAVVYPAAPALAQTFSTISLTSQPGFYLYAHAHTSHIQIQYTQNPQNWQFINNAHWKLFDGNTVTVQEVEVGTTGLCVNYSPKDFNFYADSCIAGDTNELFFVQVASSTEDEFWFINEAASVSTGQYQYMSPISNNDIVTRIAGYPSLEEWSVV